MHVDPVSWPYLSVYLSTYLAIDQIGWKARQYALERNTGHPEMTESNSPRVQTLNPNSGGGWRQPAVAPSSVSLFDKGCRPLSVLLVFIA